LGVPAGLIRWRLPDHLRGAWVQSGWWLKPINELAGRLDAFTRPLSSDDLTSERCSFGLARSAVE
jgi:hypothetical protein